MRLGLVALVVALALAVLAPAAPAQAPSGPLAIHMEASLGAPFGVGIVTGFLLNGTAVLTSPQLEGGSATAVVTGAASLAENFNLRAGEVWINAPGSLIGLIALAFTGTLDDTGNGSGRCVSSGDFEGAGTWTGRIDVEARSLVLDIHLRVVCPRCASR